MEVRRENELFKMFCNGKICLYSIATFFLSKLCLIHLHLFKKNELIY